MEKENDDISVLKFVHNLQIQNLLNVQKSLRRETLQWEIESVYMTRLLREALAWAKHTNNDSLFQKIATFLEYKRFINDDENEDDEIDGNEPESEE